jgi:hypothetical protein
MKKIFILLIISISIFSVKAHSFRYNVDKQNFIASNIASIVEYSDGIIDNIAVYPNPVVDELRISFKSSQRSIAVVSLFNNIGRQVYTQEYEVEHGNNIISIDIRSKSIEPGVYFVQLVSEGQAVTRKLIVK